VIQKIINVFWCTYYIVWYNAIIVYNIHVCIYFEHNMYYSIGVSKRRKNVYVYLDSMLSKF